VVATFDDQETPLLITSEHENYEARMPIVKRVRDPNDIGKIRRTPGVMGGGPDIAGTRIEPGFVRIFHDAGFTTEQTVDEHTHLHPEDGEAAIRYEKTRRRTSKQLRRSIRETCRRNRDRIPL
jgi:uncharacterized protein (DUF433 family)